MKLTEIFDNLSYKKLKSVKEIDPNKTYLIEVKVGGKSKADAMAFLHQARNCFEMRGITNTLFIPVEDNGATSLSVNNLSKNQIKELIQKLTTFLGE